MRAQSSGGFMDEFSAQLDDFYTLAHVHNGSASTAAGLLLCDAMPGLGQAGRGDETCHARS